jgi:transposase
MWTQENRPRYNRDHLRYPSDMTDEEWALIAPLMPPAKKGGNKRTVVMREVVNGMLYVLSTGCQWRYIPKDLPPRSTVNEYFILFQYEGIIDRIHHTLYVQCREMLDREASPTACIVDSQSVKSAEKGGSVSTPSAMTRARRSRGRSATSWSIRKVC